MGELNVENPRDPEQLRIFMQRLLDDVRALERMLDEGVIETGIDRIGAEQEVFLVDELQRPAPRAGELLTALKDPHFTTELARFNLEFNLDPIDVSGDCLSLLHRQLNHWLDRAREGARSLGFDVLLTGILPTLEKGDMSLENMAPVPRYFALNQVIRDLRGRDFRVHLQGRDELSIRHDNVMLEACNTSFQIHMQVSPERFASLYNVAQVAAAPVLAAAVGSPLLFGRRLWHETRIALFQQSLDTRSSLSHRREQYPRVSFGERWLDDSVVEIFQDDIARFRLLLTSELGDNPLESMDRGVIPDLKALRMHNGTVYRWNRPCYGVADGIAHLRIENRMLPAGPTVVDEVANAAFWFGLVRGLDRDMDDVRQVFDFDAIKRNFHSASRIGLDAQLHWIDGRTYPVRELILDELLLRARDGLEAYGISATDRDFYLGVVEERVSAGQTAARWHLDSFAALEGSSREERLVELTAALRERQETEAPVHTWSLAQGRAVEDRETYSRVSGLMTTDLFTVSQDDVLDLASSLMDWRHIRHIPVEDSEHHLVGLLTHRTLLRALTRELAGRGSRRPIPVHEVMETDLITVTPGTSTLEAIHLMEEHRIACLPVVEDGRLAGIVTERDLIRLAKPLLLRHLNPDGTIGPADAAPENPESSATTSDSKRPGNDRSEDDRSKDAAKSSEITQELDLGAIAAAEQKSKSVATDIPAA